MKYVIFIFVLLHSVLIFGQGEIDTEKKALIRHEKTFFLSINSNGWGCGFSYGKMINAFKKKIYSAELVVIKDAKEIKINNPYQPNFKRFIYGKNNIFYDFRFGYGRLIKLFDKKDKGGIEVRYFYSGGLNIGILKPVYYITSINPLKEEKFNSSLHTAGSIYGGASYFKGFDELKFVPGIFIKIGSSFEFGKKDIVINALEGGVNLDLFPKKIDIMANDKNKFYFLAIFVSYRFGKIINPRAIASKTNKK